MKNTLDKSVVEVLRQPICRTWNEIAPDAMEFVTCNEDAMEFVLDADRMYLVDPKANKLVDELCKEYGYTTVLTFLSRHIQLY